MPRKKRKYEEYMTLGVDPDGKRIRKFIFADTKPEFDRLKYEARKEFELVRNPSEITFKAYADQWLEVFKANKSLQTKAMYQYAIDKCKPFHMKPLREITALGGTENMNVLNGITLYSFRHTYATTTLYYKGVVAGHISTKKAAQIMGHSEQIFLSRYTHISDAHENPDYLISGQVVQKGDQKETKGA